MAQAATIYAFAVELADIDRGVYETLSVRVARQASETPAFMLTRLLAFCLEHTEGIVLTEGVAAGSEPAVLVRDLTGRITAWIEVGMPDAERVHRGSRQASRVAVYTHRAVPHVLAQLGGRHVFRAPAIPVFAFGDGFVDEVSATLERRSSVALSLTERQLYLDVDGRTFTTEVAEHHFD